MSDLYTIIPAAGQSRRFKDAGYETPKPLLQLKRPDGVIASMVSHVRRSVPGYVTVGFPVGSKVPSDLISSVVFIKETTGQADTVYQMIRRLPNKTSVLILDCDMVIQRSDIEQVIKFLDVYDTVLAVTETFDPNSSRVNTVPFPTQFAEKEPISQWGIVSVRAFKRADDLSTVLKTVLDNSKNAEPYLSQALKYLHGTKYAHIITEYVDLGTPERIIEAGWEIV